MEEAEREQEFLEREFGGGRHAIEELRIRDRIGLQRAEKVRAEALRGLGSHLDAALQNRDRELGMRVGGEPQAELLVGCRRPASSLLR